MNGVEVALVAAVDEVLHDRVADLAGLGEAPITGYGIRLHDAAHSGQNLFLPGPEPGWAGSFSSMRASTAQTPSALANTGFRSSSWSSGQSVTRRPTLAIRVASLPRSTPGVPHAIQNRRAGNVVQHGRGLFLRGRRQPESEIPHDFDEYTAKSERDEFAEYRVGDCADDHLPSTRPVPGLGLHEHTVDRR